MLFLKKTRHLAQRLETPEDTLVGVLERATDYYEDLILIDPSRSEKQRWVVNIRGALRALQTRFYRTVLLPKLHPSAFSHGGVRGRHIKSNAEAHLGSSFLFKTDISNFYPSVHHTRVYGLFVKEFACSPDVARLCTLLCTYRHHLALGLITSPILADRILGRVDARLGAACRKAGLVYSRFVDDLFISGHFDLSRSGFAAIVAEILAKDGFEVNPDKNKFGRFSGDVSITGLRELNGHLDVRREYLLELYRQLDDAANLSRGGEFNGPYFTRGQIAGRIHFVSWINPSRRNELVRRFRSIPWDAVASEAMARGLVALRKTLIKPEDAAGETLAD